MEYGMHYTNVVYYMYENKSRYEDWRTFTDPYDELRLYFAMGVLCVF